MRPLSLGGICGLEKKAFPQFPADFRYKQATLREDLENCYRFPQISNHLPPAFGLFPLGIQARHIQPSYNCPLSGLAGKKVRHNLSLEASPVLYVPSFLLGDHYENRSDSGCAYRPLRHCSVSQTYSPERDHSTRASSP